MAMALNKTTLKEQCDQLEMFERFLPSLDLKRRQLITEREGAREILAKSERALDDAIASHAGLFKLLGASEQDLTGLVSIESKVLAEEEVLGARLPVLKELHFRAAEYSMLAKPFWVDLLVELLREAGALGVRREIESERLRRLDEAVRQVTQRVNLFEKILIPAAKGHIHRICVYLADAERTAVVRSKIAKSRRRSYDVRAEAV